MKKISLFFFVIFLLLLHSCVKSDTEQTDYTQYVDPFIGTSFTGHTFPCAAFPLGLVQAGPETGNCSWDYCSGYVHSDTTISGFSQTRLNGTGCVDLGDLLMQPFSGELRENLVSRYDKKSEKASPGYYAVNLTDNKVRVEITVSPHVAFHRYSFAKGEFANILADFQSGLVWRKEHLFRHVREHELNFESETIVSGFSRVREWADRYYYFVIEFDRPIAKKVLLAKQDEQEKADRYIFTFNTDDSNVLNMKIALSTTSIEGAKKNLSAELKGWDFENTHNAAKQEWNKYLSRMKFEGSSDDKKKSLYTSIYHLFVQPNNIADVDGKFFTPKNEVRQSNSNNKYYSTLSQWDTFRAAFPMYTVLSPEIVADLVNSMLSFSEEQGHLPIWGLWGKETYTMIANHSVPMIVDAYLKGFKGFDVDRAYGEVKRSITTDHPRSSWSIYDQYGYYPFDLVKVESVSRTLESGFDDYCAALFAQKLGKEEDTERFMARSEYYKNLFDPETKTMRARNSEGQWRTPFDPFSLAHGDSDVGGDYTEANALQYTWHVLQDIPGLIELMGSKELALERLDSLFFTNQKSSNVLSDVTGLIGQYAHGNEPSHHIAYLYNYLNESWKTQEIIRTICDEFYKTSSDGLIGNDDCGQMSAWYLFSSIGFYPVNPVSGEFVFGAPQVPHASIEVGAGRVFSMEAKNFSTNNKYIEKIELNGKAYDKKTISYVDVMSGAHLVFYMTDKPHL